MNGEENCLSYITVHVHNEKSFIVNKIVWCCFLKYLKFLVGIILKLLSGQSWFCMQPNNSQEPIYIPCPRAQHSCLLIFYALHCLQ